MSERLSDEYIDDTIRGAEEGINWPPKDLLRAMVEIRERRDAEREGKDHPAYAIGEDGSVTLISPLLSLREAFLLASGIEVGDALRMPYDGVFPGETWECLAKDDAGPRFGLGTGLPSWRAPFDVIKAAIIGGATVVKAGGL